jgi:RNA polymerase sigma factor (sigma-70 family)
MARDLVGSPPDTRSRAIGALAEAYRLPLCAYVRSRFGVSSVEAEDLTQSFLAAVVCRDALRGYDPTRGRFRTYLRVCVDSHIRHAREASQRLKRAADERAVTLAETEAVTTESESAIDRMFEREWARSVCRVALDTVRERLTMRDRRIVYEVFALYDVAGAAGQTRPTYEAIASSLGIPVTQVTNHLAAARREFRAAVLERLHTITATDEDLRADVRSLLGVALR